MNIKVTDLITILSIIPLFAHDPNIPITRERFLGRFKKYYPYI